MELVRRLQEHPIRWALTAVFAVVIGAVAFVNMLPDFFDRNLPWLQQHLPGVSVNVQQAAAAVVVVAALTLLVLIWRNPRNHSGIQIHGVGTVTPPTREIEDLREELALSKRTAKDAQEALDRERRKVTMVLEEKQKLEVELSAVRRGGINSPLGLVARQPTVEDIKERADWILAHPGQGVMADQVMTRRIFGFGPHEAWIQAEKELIDERRISEGKPRHELAAVGRKATCTCGRTFATGPEFSAHQLEES
jgi:hypothetical protein